jgi:RNA polymerase sigma-70 factor (ECF subfamily)
MTTDQVLWERARSGDAEAFGELYENHARAVQGYCLWRTGNTQVAEDVAATVFLEAWRKRQRLALTTDTAAPLLLGIANNLMRHRWRTIRRHRDAIERIKGTTAADLGGDPEAEVMSRLEALRRVREAGDTIRALPRREQEVLALIAWGELTYEETAKALGVPVGTVRSRLARARGRLDVAESIPTATPREEGS